MRLSNGKDRFENNTFSETEWSAQILQTPEEVYHVFNQLNVVGRKITTMRSVGTDFCGSFDVLEYPERFTDTEPVECSIRLDEPFIITLDNGDNLEIHFSCDSNFRISKNCFPKNIQHYVLPNDFDADKFFPMCIEQEITGLAVTTTEFEPSYPGYDFDSDQKVYIDKVNLLLSNDLLFRFYGFYDYFDIDICNNSGKILEISMAEYRECLSKEEYLRMLEYKKECEKMNR
jgi:hypothetical protein